MHQPLITQRLTLLLLAATIVLPVAICVVLGVAALLNAMGDAVGGAALRGVALGCGILWAVDLICLVLVLAIRALGETDCRKPDNFASSEERHIGEL